MKTDSRPAPPKKDASSSARRKPFQPQILFEDDALIAVKKPCGMLSQGDGDDSLETVLRNWLKENRNHNELFVVHRLDRGTDGVMVFAKTKEASAALGAMFREHQVEKTYLALIEGAPKQPDGEIEDLLFFDRKKNKSFVVRRYRRGVKKANLSYQLEKIKLYHGFEVSLVKIRLLTGRTHQIRVQFASKKTPIVGDRRYGSVIKAGRICLSCHQLSFSHPFTREEIRLTYTPDFAKE